MKTTVVTDFNYLGISQKEYEGKKTTYIYGYYFYADEVELVKCKVPNEMYDHYKAMKCNAKVKAHITKGYRKPMDKEWLARYEITELN